MRAEKVDKKEAESHRPPAAQAAPRHRHQRLRLHQAVQEHAAQRRGDGFPNTKVRFRLFDKIKFGVTAGSGFGVGVVGTASKIALAQQPLHPA